MNDSRERWNFSTMFGWFVFRNIGIELSSEKLVLPFIYSSLGGSVFFIGFLVPIVNIASIVAQFATSRLVETATTRRGFLAVSTLINAVPLVLVALFADDIAPAWLPFLFLSTAAFMGLGSGFSILTYQNMLGYLFAPSSRSTLLYTSSAVVGVLAAIAALVSQFASTSDQDHRHLVWAGIFMMTLAAVIALALREEPDGVTKSQPTPTETVLFRDYMAAVIGNIGRARRLGWFSRYLVARCLLLSVQLAMPYFAVHAANFHSHTAISLSLFVVSSSIGLLVGGFIWPKVTKSSVLLVMQLASGIAFVAAIIALVSHLVTDLQSPYTHAIMIALLAFAVQGVINAGTLYLVSAATDEERPYCITLLNLALGAIGILIAIAMGAIAYHRGVILAIVLMAVLNVIALLYARTLSEPDTLRRQSMPA